MAYTVGGIVSGIDTDTIVAGLVEAAAASMYVMEDDLEQLEAEQEAFAGLSNRLDDFLAALEAMDTEDEFRTLTGTSADEDAVGVTLAGDAVMGSYSVEVTQLASNEMEVSDGYADKDTNGTFATGTLSITYGGTTTAITVGADDASLSDVAALINDQVDGVTAYIMDTGDATNPYRLVLVGDDTGAANTITLDTSGLDAATGTVPTFTETVTAQDASVIVNGVTVTDDDNSIDAAIQGVTFTIGEVTTSPVTVKVAQDDEGMVAKVQALVDAYNAMITYIDTNSVWDPDNDLKGAFVGETLISTITNQLQTTLTSDYSAFGTIGMLTSIGITSTQEGQLEFDEDVFREALESDFEGVVDLFTVDETDGTSSSLLTSLKDTLSMLNDEDEGLLKGRDDSIAESIETTQERIDDFEEYLADYEARLKQNFLNMELTIARLQANQSALLALMPDTSSDDSSS